MFSAGYVINAAGLYADKVARDFGFSQEYRILPFKGLYLYQREGAAPLCTNIYPVPDLAAPFLGVHLTVGVDGRVTLGSTATPAFGENTMAAWATSGCKRWGKWCFAKHCFSAFTCALPFCEYVFDEIEKTFR